MKLITALFIITEQMCLSLPQHTVLFINHHFVKFKYNTMNLKHEF